MTHILVGLLAGVCFAGFTGLRPSEPRARRKAAGGGAPSERGRATLVLESAEYHAAHRAGSAVPSGGTELVMMRDGQRPLIDYMPLGR